jgi:RND family efflux transporter MFP subunit
LELRNREAQIARIEADMAYTRRQIRRLETLAAQNNMARAELDEVESSLRMLSEDRRIAEIGRDRTLYDLQRSRVAAPFDGIVASRSMDGGEYTTAGRTLLRLVNTQDLEVSVNAPLRAADFNQRGDSVQVAAGTRMAQGTVRSVIPVGDTVSRMMEVRISLAHGEWLIGEAVTVELPGSERGSGVSVPRDALVLRDRQVYVYTVAEDNTAVRIPVNPGAGQGDYIAIDGALKAGQPVVVRGAERLHEGQPVKVIHHHLAAG